MRGEGYMVMETSEGETAVEALSPGKVLYVTPGWAHRSVCTSRQEDLVTFFAYPANAGHDYGTIERQGFRKMVLDGPNGPEIVDNPRAGGKQHIMNLKECRLLVTPTSYGKNDPRLRSELESAGWAGHLQPNRQAAHVGRSGAAASRHGRIHRRPGCHRRGRACKPPTGSR